MRKMKTKIINIIMIVILLILLSFSVQKCNSYKHQYIDTIEMFNDSIHHYKMKSGQLVVQTKIYETDIKHLKYLNDSLYSQIKSLKNKNITQATQFSGTIVNERHDTTWVIKTDTVLFAQERFKFENQYRLLEGQINVDRDKINMQIERDEMQFDYTVALDKNNNVLITSTNPYVKYNSISGFTLPKQRKKRFGIGPNFSYGYDPINNKPAFFVGIGVQYNIIKF